MTENEIGVFDISTIKKGNIVELVKEGVLEKREKSVRMIKEYILLNPDMPVDKLSKHIEELLIKVDMDIEDIRDALENREWGKVTEFNKDKNSVTLKVDIIKKKDYTELIEVLAEHISKKFTEKDVINLIKDCLADGCFTPELLKKFAKKKGKIKVETKKGCFHIVLDNKHIIPIRS